MLIVFQDLTPCNIKRYNNVSSHPPNTFIKMRATIKETESWSGKILFYNNQLTQLVPTPQAGIQ